MAIAESAPRDGGTPGGDDYYRKPQIVEMPQGLVNDFEAPNDSINLSVDAIMARLSKDFSQGGEQGEIYLGMEEWLPEGIPNPDSPLSNLKVDLINRLGCLNYQVRKLDSAPTQEDDTEEKISAEPFYQLVIRTAKPGIYITETYYPKNETSGQAGGRSMLSVRQDKPKMLEGIPAKIDFSARSMLDDLNTSVIRSMGNERLSENFLDQIKKIGWISLDVDDCLTKTSESGAVLAGRKLEDFAKLTRALNDIDVKVFLNTGRGVTDVEKIIARIEALGGKIEDAVCENGAVLYDREIALKERAGEDTDGKKPFEIDPEINEVTMAVRNAIINVLEDEVVKEGYGILEPGKVVGISVNGTAEGFQKAKNEIDVANVAKESGREIEDYKPIDIFRIWIQKLLKNESNRSIIAEGSGKSLTEIEPILNAMVGRIKNSAIAVDINPCRLTEDGQFIGIDKSRGTQNFAEKKGIEKRPDGKYDSVLGVGDSGGDLPAMKEFSSGAIPWNATIDLRENKDLNVIYFSPYEATEGINDILRVVFEGKKKTARAA